MEEEKKEIGVAVAGLGDVPEMISKLAVQMKDKGTVIVAGAENGKSYQIENGVISEFNGKLIKDNKNNPLLLVPPVPPAFKITDIPRIDVADSDTPNKLQMLKNLHLSPEQIDHIKNSPPQRLEGESQEDYKNRRMLNKLIIKYRGQF